MAPSTKKTREERREENRRRWEENDINANVRVVRAQTASLPLNDDAIPIDKLSIDALREVMFDNNASPVRRVEAAEVVLGYELPPAALAQASADPSLSGAYLCLKRIAYAPEVSDVLRFRALKATSAIESMKPRKIDPQAAERQRRREIELVNAARRAELQAYGIWPVDSQWLIGPDDIFDFPTEDETIGRAHTRARARNVLLSVRTTNRPDPFDTLPHISKDSGS